MSNLAEEIVLLSGKGDFVLGCCILALDRLPQVVGGLVAIQDGKRAARFRRDASKLKNTINEFAWDGSWYARGFTDAGKKLGWRIGHQAPAGTTHANQPNHIDYHWYRGPVEPLGVYRVTDRAGSDHDAVIADYAIVS